MIFTELITDLQNELKKELAQIRFLIKKNPGLGYNRIVEIGKEVGKRYNIKLIINFPKEGRIEEYEMYGKRDLSLIVDYERKRFPMDREIIKQKAIEMLTLKTNVHLALEQKEKAIDCCNRILKLNPKNSEAESLLNELEKI